MAYTVANLSQGTISTGANCVVTKPAGLVVNDLLIAHVAFTNFSGITTITPPSGWTQIEFTAIGSSTATATFYKLATSTETAASNFTFTADGSGTRANIGAIFTIRGARESTPGYVKAEATGSSGATITVGTITPSVANSLLLFFSACGISGAGPQTYSAYACATSNPSWAELYDFNGTSGSDTLGISCAYATRPETTGTGNLTATMSVSNQSWASHVAALEPGISFSLADTATITDDTPLMDLTFKRTDTISLTDSVQTEDKRLWNTQNKSSSSWINQDKS